MTIRARLVVILIVTALMPLALTSLAHQVSIWLARDRLAEHARQALDNNARQTLQEQLQGHVEIIESEAKLTKALLQRVAGEIELALCGPLSGTDEEILASTFGFDSECSVAPDLVHPVFRDANDPNVAVPGIDYQRQGYAVVGQANPEEVTPMQMRLASLTHVYHQVYEQAPRGTLWLSTRLNSGLMTRYPAGGSLPRNPPLKPRGLPVNRDAHRVPPAALMSGRREGPLVDPATGQVVVVMRAPIQSPQGSRIGFTSMARTIPEIFGSLALPERLGTDMEQMIIRVDPNGTKDPNALSGKRAEILLHSKLDKTAPKRRRWIKPQPLIPSDPDLHQKMIDDIAAGKPGVQKTIYKGQSCLWAYQPVAAPNVAALLVVPYTHVTQLAETMERTLIRESLFWLQLTTVVLLLATVYAIVLAVRRARALTDPIDTLVSASRRLANGDYEARVQIHSGDELEHLGNVFNDIGPKLREHGNMKLSLELARAVQQNLLPGRTPVLRNLEVTGRCLYCDETGGDYYDFIDLSEETPGRMGIVLGDVSGHGIDAALLMASIRAVTHAEARYYADRPAQMLARANGQVAQDTEDDRFVTLFYGLLEDQTRSCVWASAGHEPALWFHCKDRVIPASLQNLKKVCGGVFLGGAAGLTAQPISGV